MRKPHTTRIPQRGFTLIELMIVVAIVGILGSIALASYQAQATKSRRTDARSALLDLAGREEKLFSVTNAYTGDPTLLGYTGAIGTSFPVGSGYYNVLVAVGAPAITYTLTATPIAGSVQANDSACTTLTLNQLGQQGSTGTGTVATCWGN